MTPPVVTAKLPLHCFYLLLSPIGQHSRECGNCFLPMADRRLHDAGARILHQHARSL